MRKITLSNIEYRVMVYSPMARGNAKTDDEWETALRVMRKLKNPGLTTEDASPEEQRAQGEMRARGIPTYPDRRLLEDSAVFEFEEDEHRFLLRRLQDARSTINLAAADDYQELLERLERAPEDTPAGAST